MFSDIFEPKQKVDSVFGAIKYRKPFFHFGFWQGEVLFSPLATRVDIYIVAKKMGVLESQRKFYRELEQRYAEMTEAICKTLFETLAAYWGDRFREQEHQDFWQDFELERVFIPKPKEPTDYWELSYLHTPDKQSYTVYFSGWEPIYGQLDD